uniref:Uncharacterized protein n=1 Tax=Eutreptiella gymnastica TaxID=73025 RepID=A0A7S1IFQ1_9EUGL|mmetsp:Transcript_154157/g.269658  ORF Transcript_154157/g.269658 Transcript_154157/m.269658 type:complete len:545 (+) Transcript_154157:3-1637(+)
MACVLQQERLGHSMVPTDPLLNGPSSSDAKAAASLVVRRCVAVSSLACLAALVSAACTRPPRDTLWAANPAAQTIQGARNVRSLHLSFAQQARHPESRWMRNPGTRPAASASERNAPSAARRSGVAQSESRFPSELTVPEQRTTSLGSTNHYIWLLAWAAVPLAWVTGVLAFWHRQESQLAYATPTGGGSQFGALKLTRDLPMVLKAEGGGGDGSPFDGGAALELRSQLARLDKEWQGQQGGDLGGQQIEGSYVLCPPTIPWGVIHFIGGAVLGSYPHIAYNELLTRVCKKVGVAVIATPFDVGLDHKQLATTAVGSFRSTLSACQDRYGWSGALPVFALGHSLGSKLHVINHCQSAQQFTRIGLMAFNNYGLADSINMLETLLKEFNQTRRGVGVDDVMLKGLFNVVGRVTQAVGFQISPAPEELKRMVENGYSPRAPTTCFTFENDDLDCTEQLEDVVDVGLVQLGGNHLTPVFLKLGIDGAGQIPLAQALGTSANWTVGDEADLEKLVDALAAWLKGSTAPSSAETRAKGYRILPNGTIDV